MNTVERAVIKFAGDSGDGIQLMGSLFTEATAVMGNAIATLPDFPSEIRAPHGTVAGVSGFQIHFGTTGVHSPGDTPDLLIAMNPAALKANLAAIGPGCTVIVDVDTFRKRDLAKAGFEVDPFQNGLLEDFNVIKAPITSLVKKSIETLGLDNKSAVRCKNMFALGMVFWLFNESMDQTIAFLTQKFKNDPLLGEANTLALKAGHNHAMSIEAIKSSLTVLPAKKPPGKYRNMTGNKATAWGFLAAAKKANKDLFIGSYPITPATDILQEIAKHKWTGAKVFQAEDEIAAVCAAMGASFAGDVAITTTSGPGMALKTEGIGLAIMAELPLVIVNVQRGGPSTGLPTKTEQSDLMQALFGRNGESGAVVLAASTPANCFDWAFEATRIALEHTTPVILLSEGYLGNGAEPWKIKMLNELKEIKPQALTNYQPGWQPYKRDDKKYARYWVAPGVKNMQHRIGGLEKEEYSGGISYDPENHERMSRIREEKVKRVAGFIPAQRYKGKSATKLLIVGWGGQFGILFGAVKELQIEGKNIAFTHFNYINPLPENTAEIFAKFDRILVCELNNGQFANYLSMQFPQFYFEKYNKMQGVPFKISELKDKFNKILEVA